MKGMLQDGVPPEELQPRLYEVISSDQAPTHDGTKGTKPGIKILQTSL
jgi:hypothetical protein